MGVKIDIAGSNDHAPGVDDAVRGGVAQDLDFRDLAASLMATSPVNQGIAGAIDDMAAADNDVIAQRGLAPDAADDYRRRQRDAQRYSSSCCTPSLPARRFRRAVDTSRNCVLAGRGDRARNQTQRLACLMRDNGLRFDILRQHASARWVIKTTTFTSNLSQSPQKPPQIDKNRNRLSLIFCGWRDGFSKSPRNEM